MLRSTLARTIRRAVPTITLRHAAAAAAAAAATTSYVLCERKPARRSLNAVLTESLPEALRVSFLSARQVEQTVTLLNAVLDLDNFTDEEEQLIFKHAVCQVVRAIEETLPRPFLTLCTRSAERAPSRGRYSSGDVEGLDAEQAERLVERLGDAVQGRVTLPWLDQKQEWQLVQCVVELVVCGMRRGSSFDDALGIEVAGPVLIKTFVKGGCGDFFSKRDGVVDALADDLDIPVLPQSWKRAVCARVIDTLADVLETALMESFNDHLKKVVAAAVAAADADATAREAAPAARVAAAAAAATEAAEAEAAVAAVPFDRRVVASLCKSLQLRAPAPLQGATEGVATRAVELALASTFASAAQMNDSVAYVLDQIRLARRLRGAPPAARELLLRKKEQILGAVLAMDADGDGAVSSREFAKGMKALGVALSSRDSAALFEALDADGSGSLAPLELEVLLFGRRLDDERRAALLADAHRHTRHRADRGARRRDNDGGGASVGGLLRLLPIYILGRLRPASDASGPEDKT